MNARRGRAVAFLSLCVGFLVLLGTLFVFRERLFEEWHIWKLRSGHLEERQVAAGRLGEMGSVRAVPHLLQTWKESNPGWWRSANREEPLRALEQAGESPNLQAILQAILAVGPEGIPALLETVRDPDAELRGLATMSLIGLKEPVQVVSALIDAIEGHDEAADDYLLTALSHVSGSFSGSLMENGLLRRFSAQALSEAGPAGPQALLSALRKMGPEVEKQAARYLEHLGDPDALPGIVEGIQKRMARLQQAAAMALKSLGGRSARETVPHLFPKLIKWQKWKASSLEVEVLARLGEPGIRTLIMLLPDGEIGGAAGKALAGLGEEAIPQLVETLRERKGILQGEAALVLGRMGAPAFPVLQRELAEGPLEAQRAVIAALGELGSPALDFLPALMVALEDPALAGRAIAALAHIGPDAGAAAPAVARLLEDPSASVRYDAAYALGRFERAASWAVPGLIAALKDANRGVRLGAVRSLMAIAPAEQGALLAIEEALKKEDVAFRAQVRAARSRMSVIREEPQGGNR